MSDVDTVQAEREDLLARLTRLEAQNVQLLAEKGIPADPFAAKVKALRDHLDARAAMTPQYDFSEFAAMLNALPESDATSAHTAPIAFHTSRWDRKFPGIVGELGYLIQLADELHEMVLAGEATD